MERIGLLDQDGQIVDDRDIELEDFNDSSDNEELTTGKQEEKLFSSWWLKDVLPIRNLDKSSKWFIGAGSFAAVATISLFLIFIIHRSRQTNDPETGVYSIDAPFREVIRTNFPDPALLYQNGTWYAYATNNAAGILDSRIHGRLKNLGAENIQLATSTDFLNWKVHLTEPAPLQELGTWVTTETMPAPADSSVLVRRANVWAPDIVQRPDGKYVLYYSATAKNQKRIHCFGAAVGDAPAGPFTPHPKPIDCPLEIGGAIDPGVFVDTDSSIYVAYKIDGNAVGRGGECLNTIEPLKNTPIKLQKMESDGITPSGNAITILDRTAEDGPLVEAAALARSEEGIYFLFFSSGCTFNPSYNVKYAASTNIQGPYIRASGTLLETGFHGLLAPGSPAVWVDEGRARIAFHARLYTDLGGIRAMYVANLKFNGIKVTLEAPT